MGLKQCFSRGVAPHPGYSPVGLFTLRFFSLTGGRSTISASVWARGTITYNPWQLVSLDVVFSAHACADHWLAKYSRRTLSRFAKCSPCLPPSGPLPHTHTPALPPTPSCPFSFLPPWLSAALSSLVFILLTPVFLLTQTLRCISSTPKACWALPPGSLPAQLCGISQDCQLGPSQCCPSASCSSGITAFGCLSFTIFQTVFCPYLGVVSSERIDLGPYSILARRKSL